MNLNKIGFWGISATAFLVSFIMGIDYLTEQGYLPAAGKCTIVTWGIIFVSMLVTIKLLSIFERMNKSVDNLKAELENAQWEMDNLYLNNSPFAHEIPAAKIAVNNSNIIPFPFSTRSYRKA